ncbi:MAG: hypothetical protein ACXW0Q_12730 [Methylovulum sp.]
MKHIRKKPPYSRILKTHDGTCLVICTGEDAWERGMSATWFHGHKLVLPPGDDPGVYDWGVAVGHDVMIAGFGNPEPISTIAKLAGLLRGAGAGLVLYAPENMPMMRIDARRLAA